MAYNNPRRRGVDAPGSEAGGRGTTASQHMFPHSLWTHNVHILLPKPRNPNKCVHLEVPTGTLPEPLWQTAPLTHDRSVLTLGCLGMRTPPPNPHPFWPPPGPPSLLPSSFMVHPPHSISLKTAKGGGGSGPGFDTPPPNREVLEWPSTIGGGGSPPGTPPAPDQSDQSGKKKFVTGKTLSGHFCFTNFWVPDPTNTSLPPPPPLMTESHPVHSMSSQLQAPCPPGGHHSSQC